MAYFGDLGGLFGIIMIFGHTISVTLVTRLFQAAMVESTYRIQGYSEDYNEEYEQEIVAEEQVVEQKIEPEDNDTANTPDEFSISRENLRRKSTL